MSTKTCSTMCAIDFCELTVVLLKSSYTTRMYPGVFSFLILTLKYILSSHFDIWHFCILRPINFYKDMLNNMVSLIDHVVMNHRNQTRTNDI
jgi:hypothetical protein